VKNFVFSPVADMVVQMTVVAGSALAIVGRVRAGKRIS